MKREVRRACHARTHGVFVMISAKCPTTTEKPEISESIAQLSGSVYMPCIPAYRGVIFDSLAPKHAE